MRVEKVFDPAGARVTSPKRRTNRPQSEGQKGKQVRYRPKAGPLHRRRRFHMVARVASNELATWWGGLASKGVDPRRTWLSG